MQNTFFAVADYSVQALTALTAAYIPRHAVEQLAFARPTVGKALWLDALADGSMLREWIVNVGRRDAHARVAHLICELACRMEAAGLGDRTGFQLPFSQEQIGDAVGLTSVHVNRMLKRLDGEGLTRRTGRAIVIADWRGLTRAGGFDPTYLHLPGGYDEAVPV